MSALFRGAELRAPRLVCIVGVVMFTSLLALTGCGGQPPLDPPEQTDNVPPDGNGSNGSPEPLWDFADLDAVLAGLVDSPADSVPDARVTYSLDLIERAYREGAIREEEYFRLGVTAMFDHGRLDAPYRAEFAPEVHATSLLRLIGMGIDGLSAEAQEELRPYVLAMDDSDSFWHNAEQTLEVARRAKFAGRSYPFAMDRPLPDGGYWLVTGPAGTEAKQRVVEEALEHAYQRFADLGFPEPTDWLRVSLRRTLPTAGVEYMAEWEGRRRCHILLRSNLEDDVLRSVTAHELFHCFQEYVTPAVPYQHPQWLWESTAVWSEDYAYPDINREHTYDDEFFRTLPDYFFDSGGTREYASYFYWFYLDQKSGKTGTAVRDLFLDMYAEGTEVALLSQPGFQESFKEYALWNLNKPPMKFYEDFHDMPTGSPSGRSVTVRRLNPRSQLSESVFVAEGGMLYFVYAVDDAVDKLRFDLSEIRKTAENQNGVQIVYKVGEEWFYEDVSWLDELVFCRQRASERVRGIVLIISNGDFDITDWDSALSGVMEVDATEACTLQWHGEVVCMWSRSGTGDVEGYHSPLGNYQSGGTRRVSETLVFDGESDTFYTTSYTVSQNSNYRWEHTPPVPDSDITYIAWERRVQNISAGRSETMTIPADCPPFCEGRLIARIRPISGEWPRRYLLRSVIFANIGPYESVYTAYYVPGELGRMQGHVAEERSKTVTHDLSASCPPTAFELEMSIDGRRLTGSYSDENWTCTAEYAYE